MIVNTCKTLQKNRHLQYANGVGRSSTLAPASHTNNLVTSLDKSVLFAKVHSELNASIHVLAPILNAVI